MYYYFSVYVINSKNSFFVPPAFCRKRVQRYIEISIPTRETAIIFDILAIIDLNQGETEAIDAIEAIEAIDTIDTIEAIEAIDTIEAIETIDAIEAIAAKADP